MSNLSKYILLGVVVIAIGALLYFNQKKEKKRFDWRETYAEKSKEPFGTAVVRSLLKSYFTNDSLTDLKEPIKKSLPNPDSLKAPATYMFMGDGFYADTADIDKLLLFTYEGNKAFIAANAVPNYLLERVFKDSCEDEYETYNSFREEYSDSIDLNFNHPQLVENKAFAFEFIIAEKKYPHDWSYIDTLRGECTEGAKNITPLGFFKNNNTKFKDDNVFVNFIKVPYGRGSVFIHTNPIVFTNFHLLDSTKARYVAKSFSHLTAGAIYWDTKSRTSRDVVRRMNGSNTRLQKDGPLKYILEQPALRWAWFIFLSLIGLYLFFGSKRRQRTIPILEEKSNTSLEFIQTIGQMYFRTGEHVRLCEMMMKQFQTFVRERYGLTSREMNNEFVETLSAKAGIPFEHIKKIVNYEHLIARRSLTDDSMVDFHYLLNIFYKSCK
jgi:hypothetical protein